MSGPFMSTQDVSVIIAAFSAVASAVSAIVNLWNTSNFRRQLQSTTIDACVAASGALKAAVHKTIELKANRVDNITPAEIRGAYDDAWTKWVAFDQAFRVAQRYSRAYDFDAPDKTSELLSQLRISLRDPDWFPAGLNDPRDIRTAVNDIVARIQQQSGQA
jgi:hypothetical protein